MKLQIVLVCALFAYAYAAPVPEEEAPTTAAENAATEAVTELVKTTEVVKEAKSFAIEEEKPAEVPVVEEKKEDAPKEEKPVEEEPVAPTTPNSELSTAAIEVKSELKSEEKSEEKLESAEKSEEKKEESEELNIVKEKRSDLPAAPVQEESAASVAENAPTDSAVTEQNVETTTAIEVGEVTTAASSAVEATTSSKDDDSSESKESEESDEKKD